MALYDPFKAQPTDDSFWKAALRPGPRLGQRTKTEEKTMTTILPHFIEKAAYAGNGGGLEATPRDPQKKEDLKSPLTTAEKNANKNAISCPPTFNKG